MILDSRNGDTGWVTYHAEEVRVLKYVVWVNQEDLTWGELSPTPYGRHEVIYHAKRISIYPSRRLIVINEIDDTSEDEIMRQIEVAA